MNSVIKTWGPSKGTIIERNGMIVFLKQVKRKEHHMHVYKAWGFSKDIVDAMRLEGVELIILNVVDEGKYLRVDMDDFDKHVYLKQYNGYDAQYFLNDKYWTEDGM